MADRIARCRMTNTTNDRCTGEALDPNGEILICVRHAGLVLELVRAAEVIRERCAEDRELLAVERKGLADERELLGQSRDLLREIRDGLDSAEKLVVEIREIAR